MTLLRRLLRRCPGCEQQVPASELAARDGVKLCPSCRSLFDADRLLPSIAR